MRFYATTSSFRLFYGFGGNNCSTAGFGGRFGAVWRARRRNRQESTAVDCVPDTTDGIELSMSGLQDCCWRRRVASIDMSICIDGNDGSDLPMRYLRYLMAKLLGSHKKITMSHVLNLHPVILFASQKLHT